MAQLEKVVGNIGRGLLGGLAGTAAITIAQLVENRVTGPDQSNEMEEVPAEAVEQVIGVHPHGKKQKAQMSQIVHWSYGTGWGAFPPLLGAFGVRGGTVTLLHFVALSTTAALLLPALGVAPPPQETPTPKIIAQSLNHFLYALIVGWVYDALNSGEENE